MPDGDQARLRAILTGEDPGLVARRDSLRRIPSAPRCKLCAAPFGPPGGMILGRLGFGRFAGNPALCNNCIATFEKKGITGAEIPLSVLFADVRGSTAIGERLSPADFRAFLQSFYDLTLRAMLDHEGIVDKLVGDEVIGLFIGGVAGPRHASAAIEAAKELLGRATAQHASAQGRIPVGAAVHTGEAYVGTVGTAGAATDFTALGDAVNTTSRLTALAGPGELLVSSAAAEAAGLDDAGLERRTLPIRGRVDPVEVVVLRPALR